MLTKNESFLKYIWCIFILFIAQLTYTAYFLSDKTIHFEPKLFLESPIVQVITFIAIIEIIIAIFVIPKVFYKQQNANVFVLFLLQFVFLESIAVLGFVVFFLEKSLGAGLLFIAISLLAFFMNFPSESKILAAKNKFIK